MKFKNWDFIIENKVIAFQKLGFQNFRFWDLKIWGLLFQNLEIRISIFGSGILEFAISKIRNSEL